MRIIDRIRTYFTREEIEDKKVEVIKNGLDVILLYCNYFDTYLDKINIVFYLDFDEDKVNILDLMKYGRYDNSTHIFVTSYKDLLNMRLENRSSLIVDEFFARISDALNLDTITNIRAEEREVSNVLFNIIKIYAGYNDRKIKLKCGVIDSPNDFDHYACEINRLVGKEVDFRPYTLIKMNLTEIPFYFLAYIAPYAENLLVNICKERPHDFVSNDNFIASFEGRSASVNETIAIYNVINYADTCPESIRTSILPQGCALNVEFTITLDRIFTCLDKSENDVFRSFFKNEILLHLFTEEDIDNLSYTRKKTDEEVQDDFDKEIDEIILIDDEGGDEDEDR